MPDLRESYSYTDDKPFGASLAYELLKHSYPSQKTEIINKQFGENYEWEYDTASVYFNVSRNWYVTDQDAESLLGFVYKGNTAFIAAEHIDTLLLNKLYCKQTQNFNWIFSGNIFQHTSQVFVENLGAPKDSFSYYFYPFSNYFSEANDSYGRILGYNQDHKASFFVFFWGKGKIYFHSEPKAMSNYFLLTANNYKYFQFILRMLPSSPQNIYWDDFHNGHNYPDGRKGDKSFSTLSTVMRYPSLAKAFYIALAMLLLYILFNSKRRQRIIPIIKPPENTTIVFAEAIAGLYLSKKDNRLIAEKMITYFKEHIRTKYFLSMQPQEEGFAEMLSRKSDVKMIIVGPLTDTIKRLSVATKVTDQELLLLNDLTEKFLKNKV